MKITSKTELTDGDALSLGPHPVWLPCEVGDPVYYILNMRIMEGTVKEFRVYAEDVVRIHVDFPNTFCMNILASEVGKSLFFNREAAERVLEAT